MDGDFGPKRPARRPFYGDAGCAAFSLNLMESEALFLFIYTKSKVRNAQYVAYSGLLM